MKVGMVLSGGGIRGIAHLGVIKALEEMNIKVDIISGTSVGAIIGAFYAAGMHPDDILEVGLKLNKWQAFSPAWSRSGLLKMNFLKNILTKNLPVKSFSELKKELIISATKLGNAKTHYFTEGDLIDSILASASIPVVFKPFRIGDTKYVDGGVVNNLPVEPLLGKCDKLIGVLCNPIDQQFAKVNLKSMIERVMLITINTNTYSRRELCDIILEPPELRTINVFSFDKILEIFNIGYYYARDQKSQLSKLTR